MFRWVALFMTFAMTGSLWATDENAATPKQFLYVLHLVSRLYDEKAWTKEDAAAVENHFNRLKQATDRGQVFFAGRTAEPNDKTFGLVVFETADEGAAQVFMNSDPAVTAGVMTAELHPFTIVLQRK